MEDVAIIGGGLAGAAAAWHLATAGRQVRLFERDVAPRHKICGEFFSVEAQAMLRDIGLDPATLGASAIDRLRLVHGRSTAEIDLPFRAYGMTRRKMDAVLLDRAEAAGATVERGVTVRALDGMVLQLQSGRVTGRHQILASGKHDVRGTKRVSRGTVADLIGFKNYFRLAPSQQAALAGYVEVMLFPGGYAGLQLVENQVANLCLLVTRATFADAGDWLQLLGRLRAFCGHLDDRLAGAEALLDRPLTIAGVPYGFRYRPASSDLPQRFRVGDQAAVIPSFSGDGMAIALHSGRGAAGAILGGEDARSFHARQRREFGGQIRLAGALYQLGRPAALQPLLVDIARQWPGLAARLATWTRIPPAYRSNRSAPSRSISDASWVT